MRASVVASLNYFNYFTEIEDAFIRRRGKHLLLSPIDWALIESWKEMNIPLHIVLRGIERAFDSWQSKPRKRTVKSLLYCQEEVEAQFAEWVESRVGATADGPGQFDTTADNSEALPFTRAAIGEHLQHIRSELLRVAEERKKFSDDDLTDSLGRATEILTALQQDFSDHRAVDARSLEDSLSGLERMLNHGIISVMPSQQLAAANKQVAELLQPYRSKMDQAIFQQTQNNLLLKQLREELGIPRLSLFYLAL